MSFGELPEEIYVCHQCNWYSDAGHCTLLDIEVARYDTCPHFDATGG
jgi:hypothetical protein